MAINPSMLPVGYTFCPTHEELLGYYLFNKIVGEHVPLFALPVIDLYSQEPSQIWQLCGGIDGQDIYIFTHLKKKKSRIIRKVGSNGGTWSSENKAQRVFSSTNDILIGSFKRFHYENKVKSSSDNDCCSWIMYEYTLDPAIVPKGLVHDSYVLCMIRKKIVKMEKLAVSLKRPTPYNWPATTTDIGVDDQTHKRIKLGEQVVGLEKEFCIDEVDFKNENCNNTRPFIGEELQELLHGNNLEPLQPQKEILMIDNQSHEKILWNQNCIDVEFANQCPTTQRQSCYQDFSNDDAMFAKEIEMELEQCDNLDQSNVEDGSTYDNQCPTTQKESCDQEFSNDDAIFAKQIEMDLEQCDNLDQSNVEDGSTYDNQCPTTQKESCDQDFSNDDAIFAKQIEMALEQCEEQSNVENGSSYDNEWYFR